MASRDIKDLHKNLQYKYMKFASMMAEAQVPFIVTCTYRTQEEQDALFEQGRTKPGKIVTWTRASKHSYMENNVPASKAFDIAIVHEKKPTWDLKVDVDKDDYPDYAEAANIGRTIGLKAGADFDDYCHFELIENTAIAQPVVVESKPETEAITVSEKPSIGIIGAIKLIIAAMGGKDAWKEESDKPLQYRQRFWGKAIIALSILVPVLLEKEIDPEVIKTTVEGFNLLISHVTHVIQHINEDIVPLIVAIGTGWGLFVNQKGKKDAVKRSTKSG